MGSCPEVSERRAPSAGALHKWVNSASDRSLSGGKRRYTLAPGPPQPYLVGIRPAGRAPVEPFQPIDVMLTVVTSRPPNAADAVLDAYLGFRVGDVVLDLAELTAGTATIKEFRIVAGNQFNDMAVVAIMETGAERFVTQLKTVRPTDAPDADVAAGPSIVPFHRRRP